MTGVGAAALGVSINSEVYQWQLATAVTAAARGGTTSLAVWTGLFPIQLFQLCWCLAYQWHTRGNAYLAACLIQSANSYLGLA